MAVAVGTQFKQGQVCSRSGIYKVAHDPKHKAEHEVTVVTGRRFPPCRDCNGGVRFVLIHGAKHLDRHPGFDHSAG